MGGFVKLAEARTVAARDALALQRGRGVPYVLSFLSLSLVKRGLCRIRK